MFVNVQHAIALYCTIRVALLNDNAYLFTKKKKIISLCYLWHLHNSIFMFFFLIFYATYVNIDRNPKHRVFSIMKFMWNSFFIIPFYYYLFVSLCNVLTINANIQHCLYLNSYEEKFNNLIYCHIFVFCIGILIVGKSFYYFALTIR